MSPIVVVHVVVSSLSLSSPSSSLSPCSVCPIIIIIIVSVNPTHLSRIEKLHFKAVYGLLPCHLINVNPKDP